MCSSKFRNIFEDFCESEKHRFQNFIPVGMGIGICSYFSLDNEPSFLLNAIILIALITACVFIKSHKWILYILLTVSFGFFISQLRTKMVDTFMLSKKGDELTWLVASIESCEKTPKGLTFIVGDVKSRKYPRLNKLQLTWRGKKALASKTDYAPGMKALFRVMLSPLNPLAFPGAYDFKKQQYFKGISARGFITVSPKILKSPSRTSLDLFIGQLRHSIDKKIEDHLSPDIAAVAKALITGNKSGISKEIRRDFANSGTAHLLAISGLHMSIIGFFVFWLFRIFFCFCPRISMFYDAKKISAIISWIVVVFYLQISGSSVPSVRAFIMHTIIILAILLNRRALTMRSVAIAATIIMIFSPEMILFPSFQMSFGAVIAIVALYERARDFSNVFKWLFDAMATTVAASIPTTLFSVSTFNQLTLNSVLANLISVPLMSFFVMPVAVMAIFFMLFDFSQPILLMGYGVQLLMKVSEKSAQLPGSYFVMASPSPINMGIFIFSGLILLLIRHKIRFCGIAGIAIGVIYYCLNPTSEIFISPKSKAIGVKTDDGVACFNHLGYFRFLTFAWAKSVGLEKRERFDSEICEKYVTKISDSAYSI
ncbi:MAG: ComEC family competence protein, partial [Holosporaceae bacterium]|nr:ComEC family competence protein [Holosporaceae bacterium]